jgi:uncharacterized protein (DUF302 family)
VSQEPDSDYVEHESAHNFALTVERVGNAIEVAGMKILARVDHAAGAKQVGETMPPTLVLFYGNPKGGTPVMQATPKAALDLPLKVLIRETADGKVLVAYHPIAPMLRRDGVSEEIATRLEPAQQLLAASIR